MSRRKFLNKGAAAAIGLAVVPGTVLGKKFGHTAPSDKLNILGVGIGGRGSSVLRGLESQNIIGLCDVDWKYADHIFKRYPAAKKFNDYRKMYDEMLKSADAVMVATADHTHAIIAADAITAGKHVYCEKPLTHTVYESRLLTKLAAAMVMPGLRAFKAQLDPNKVGGTAFIGISKPVIKAHGASNAEAIDNAIGQARQVAESGIIGQIQENVHLMQIQAE